MVQVARPSADDTDGNWLDQDDGSSLYAAIDEASADGATTHIYSTDNGGNDTCIVNLASISAPGSGSVYIKYTALVEDGSGMGAPGVKFQLFEGTDARGAAHTNNSVATSYTAVASSAIDVSSVSNWGNLKLRITLLTNAGSGMDYIRVTQAYLETPDAGGGGSTPIAAISMNTYRQMRN
tara:strand:- start:95 stop:634 length:540 start_codon:yes stop_codon:yes gene_type:complete